MSQLVTPKVFKISEKMNTITTTYPAREVMGMEVKGYTQEEFVIPDEIAKQYISKIFSMARESEGKEHDFHLGDCGLVCRNSTPATSDYDDSYECDARFGFSNLQVEYEGNIYLVERNSKKDTELVAFREVA